MFIRSRQGPLIPLFFICSSIALGCLFEGLVLSYLSPSWLSLSLFGLSVAYGVMSETLMMDWRWYTTARENLVWERLSLIKRVYFFFFLASPIFLVVFYWSEAKQWWNHERRVVPTRSEVLGVFLSVGISVLLLIFTFVVL